MTSNDQADEEHSDSSGSHKVVFLGILLAVSLSVWLQYEPYSFLRRDASFYATITRGLSEDGSLRAESLQPSSWYTGNHPHYQELDASWSNVSIGTNGEWYPKHSFVMSAIAVPFYHVLGIPGLLIFNLLAIVAILFSAYLLAQPLVRGPPLIFALVLIGTGATFIDQTYQFSSDVFSAAVVLVGFVCLNRRKCLWAGFLFGLALWARPTLVILIAPVAFVMSYRILKKPEVRRVALGMVPCIFAGALANWLMFGAPWTSGYDRILVVHEGVPALESAKNLFTLSWSDGLERMFSGPKNGFFDNAPAALMGMAGLASLIRYSKRTTVALALATLGYIFFFATYSYSHPRFFLAWMGLLATPLALLLDDLASLLKAPFDKLEPEPKRTKLLALGLIIIAIGIWQFSVHVSSSNTLTDRMTQAKVTRNNIDCDYYNMRHGRWECSKIERHLWEYTGLALDEDDCRFGGDKKDMIFFHPPLTGATKMITFPIEDDEKVLRLTFGLADSAANNETCFDVLVEGRPKNSLCTDRQGLLITKDIDLHGASSITFAASGRTGGRQHLCIQGRFSD